MKYVPSRRTNKQIWLRCERFATGKARFFKVDTAMNGPFDSTFSARSTSGAHALWKCELSLSESRHPAPSPPVGPDWHHRFSKARKPIRTFVLSHDDECNSCLGMKFEKTDRVTEGWKNQQNDP